MKSKIVKPKNLRTSPTYQLHSTNHSSLLSTSQQISEARATFNYNKQQIQNEELFDTFMENSLVLPLNEAFEPQIKQMFHSEKCVLWIDQPEQQILYSPTFSLTAGYINSLPGFIYKTKNVIQVRDPSQAPGGYVSDQRIASPNSPQLFFPITTFGTVRGVVQIVKKQGSGGFTENDMQITSQIMRKFSIYGDSLFTSRSLSQVALSLYSSSTNKSSNSGKQNLNPLELIQRHFHCQKVELFHFDINRMTCQSYDPVHHEMIPIVPEKENDFGLVGFSVSTQTTINSNDTKSECHFSPFFDSQIEGPLLAVPLMSGKRDAWCVALRGRTKMFSTTDESQLSALLPFLVRSIAGFSSSGEQSEFNAQLTELLECAASLVMMSTVTKIKYTNLTSDLTSISSECIETTEIAKLIEEKAVSLMQCEKALVYLVDRTTKELVAANNAGGMVKRFPFNSGISGKILNEKSAINLTEPASNDQFSSEIDSIAGYTPKSLLGVPVFDKNDEVCAVVLLLTKNDSNSFDENDQKLLKALTVFAGIALHNACLYRSSVLLTQKIRAFFDLMRHTNEEAKLKPILEEILNDSLSLLQSSRISMFVYDDSKSVLEKFLEVGKSDSGFDFTFSMKALKERKTVSFNHNEIKKTAPKSRNQEKYNKNDFTSFQSISEIFEGVGSYIKSSSRSKEIEKLICIPLFNREMAVLGVLEVYFTSPHKNEIDLIESITELAQSFLERVDIKYLRAINHFEIDLRDFLSEEEGKMCEIPSKLRIDSKDEMKEILSTKFDSLKWDGIGLFKVIFFIFDHFGLMKSFDIKSEVLFNFLFEVSRAYSTTSHHNFRHAVNVTQFTSTIINSSEKVGSILTKEEVLSLIVASICHDIDHDFELSQTSLDPYRLLFSQQSALETRSCTFSISILSKPNCDIFHFFSKDDNAIEKVWLTFINLVLSTDMAKHFTFYDQIRQIVDREELDVEGKEEHRLMLMKLIMKCADLGDVARIGEVADREKETVYEEFFLQGETERLEVKDEKEGSENGDDDGEVADDGGCDGFKKKVVKFYEMICLPLFETLAKVMSGTDFMYEMAKKNIGLWTSAGEK